MFNKTKKMLSLGALALSLFAAGCSEAGAGENDSKTLYFIPVVDTGAYWNPMRLGAEETAERLGYELIVRTSPPAQTDKNQLHISFVNEAISNNAAGIAIAPIEANMFRNPIVEAMDAGIPVITFDGDLENEADRTAFVGTNNLEAGAELARNAIARFKEEGITEGAISIVTVDRAMPNMILRERGIKEEFERELGPDHNFTFLETIMDNDQAAVSKEQLEGQLIANDDIVAVFTLGSEGPNMGTMEALNAQGKAGTVLHFGFDWTPTWLQGIEDGRITGIVDQDAYQIGVQVIENLVAAIEGKEIPSVIPIAVNYVEAADLPAYGEAKAAQQTETTE